MMDNLGKVLIIDDEPGLRQTLTRILHQAGCEVISASNGAEALRRLSSDSFDLVYLDLRLPDMNGLTVLKEFRQRDSKGPVILLTAYGSLQTALEALRLGATDYLLKPIDPEILVARTRTVLQEKAVERRRQEIQEQIEALQAELRSLGTIETVAASSSPTTPPPENRFVKRGRLILDMAARRATFGEIVLSLPPTTFDYLAVLAWHAPDVVDYRTLVVEAQGYESSQAEAKELAKYHIHVLRQALETDAQHPHRILNVRGSGYRLLLD
jgi:DNA-binding response OmpR family regulator